jgi:hypothetical protein
VHGQIVPRLLPLQLQNGGVELLARLRRRHPPRLGLPASDPPRDPPGGLASPRWAAAFGGKGVSLRRRHLRH